MNIILDYGPSCGFLGLEIEAMNIIDQRLQVERDIFSLHCFMNEDIFVCRM